MHSERIQIRRSRTARGISVLVPSGELDFNSAPALQAAITAAGRLPCAVVDLSHITFIDSTGITALLGAGRTLEEAGGWLRLCSIPETPLRAIELVGVDQVIDVYPTLDAALQT
ncbi:STAS domain-containing protein [Streptomyces sp. NPDC006733]|uniref:STAS domain-containing protein n=1 Tax=Streptomyces sp. NPDC006733 TaxID=3155460 RepID=UPI0033DD5B3B